MDEIIGDIAGWKEPHLWLLAGGHLLWIAAYLASAWSSFRDRLPAIPIAAIVLNVAWEYIFLSGCAPLYIPGIDSGVVWRFCGSGKLTAAMFWLLAAWFVVDLLLLVQAAIWGSNLSAGASSEPGVPTPQWWVLLGAAVLGAVALQAGLIMVFGDVGGTLIAWLGNLIMSALFIDLVRRRRRGAGLSYPAAWFKLLGSAFIASALIAKWVVGKESPDLRLITLFVLVLLLDLAYVRMLGRARAEPLAPPALADA